MKPLSLRTKLEEIRQARRIHGGVLNLWVASLGVRLSRVPIPSRRLRLLVFKTLYGKKYPALDEGELEQSLWSFRSLNALFTRGLRPECRPISAAANQFLCPCDSRVQDVGRLERDRLLTVKGTEYTLNALLPGVGGGKFEGGILPFCFCHPVIATVCSARRTRFSKKSSTFQDGVCSFIRLTRKRNIRFFLSTNVSS